jgi:hypothetical protein
MKTPVLWGCCLISVLLLSSCEKPNLSDKDRSEKNDTAEVDPPDTTNVPGGTTDTTVVVPKDPDENGGSEPSSGGDQTTFQTGDTVTVNQFIKCKINGGVYVHGYIVGCAYKKRVYLSPGNFTGKTSVLLASCPGEKDTNKMIAVALKGKYIKSDVNLVDHPENYGKVLMVFGYRGLYMGFLGITDGYDYSLH